MSNDTRDFLQGIMDGKSPIKKYNQQTGKYEDKYIRYNDNTEEFDDMPQNGAINQSMMPQKQNAFGQSLMPGNWNNQFEKNNVQDSGWLEQNADMVNSSLENFGGAAANFSQGYTYGLDNVFAGAVNAIGAAPVDYFKGKSYKQALIDRYNEFQQPANKMQDEFKENNPQTAEILNDLGFAYSPGTRWLLKFFGK